MVYDPVLRPQSINMYNFKTLHISSPYIYIPTAHHNSNT